MKSIVLGIGSILLFSFAAAAAEDGPKMETFLGYTFTRANSATNIPSCMNGGNGQFVYNFNDWFGGVADLGAGHNCSIHKINLDSTLANFLLGPRVAVRPGFAGFLAACQWNGCAP